jgi:hypothetical protein
MRVGVEFRRPASYTFGLTLKGGPEMLAGKRILLIIGGGIAAYKAISGAGPDAGGSGIRDAAFGGGTGEVEGA